MSRNAKSCKPFVLKVYTTHSTHLNTYNCIGITVQHERLHPERHIFPLGTRFLTQCPTSLLTPDSASMVLPLQGTPAWSELNSPSFQWGFIVLGCRVTLFIAQINVGSLAQELINYGCRPGSHSHMLDTQSWKLNDPIKSNCSISILWLELGRFAVQRWIRNDLLPAHEFRTFRSGLTFECFLFQDDNKDEEMYHEWITEWIYVFYIEQFIWWNE